MQIASLFIAVSVAVVGALGAFHLAFTYHGNKLHPRDAAVQLAMERTHPVITRQTTVWRATKGFNASHSLGLITFAMVYGYLAVWRFDALAGSTFLLALGLSVQLAYLVLAYLYFFSTPQQGIALAFALYLCGWMLI